MWGSRVGGGCGERRGRASRFDLALFLLGLRLDR